MLSKPVEEAVEGLIELSVLNEDALIRLSRLFAALKALREAGSAETVVEPVKVEPKAEDTPPGQPDRDEQRRSEQPPAPDPEFTDDMPGVEILEAPTILKAIPGFVAGYSEKNLEKEPTLPKPRKPNGSFHVTQQDLMALRTSKTIKQIATECGVSVSTVVNRLREFGLTRA